MSLLDYYTGQQSWADYVSNRDLARRFENSLTKTGDRLAIQLSRDERNAALVEGLGAIESGLAADNADLLYELQDISAGIDRLNADFHILMGDVVWRLERQTATLNNILRTIQAPLDTASKELRARAEDAYRNGWYEEALADFLQSEQKNYQDFAVDRSIGNIYLYHLVDLSKAVEYFQKAARYARPRDSRQAAEAEFFAGVASGLQQDYASALKHMHEAISLNRQLYEAYYACASFAMLLGHVDIVLENVDQAIHGDARYYERCRHDPCFDKIRGQIDSLLARLLATEAGVANSRINELQQAVQRLRQMGVAEGVLQKYSTQLQEIGDIWKQGDYSAVRMAATRAFEILGAFLDDGIKSLEGTAKGIADEIARRRSELTRNAEQIAQQSASMMGKKQQLGSPGAMIGVLIFGSYCLYHSWTAFYWRFFVADSALTAAYALTPFWSIPGLIIGGWCILGAGGSLISRANLDSQIRHLDSEASRARDQLRPGRDESLCQLETRLSEVQKHRDEISKMLADIPSHMPAGLLLAGGARSSAPIVDEKIGFTVILTAAGPNRINVIKAVREVTGLGLKEAKDLVDGIPRTIKASISKEEVEAIKSRFTAEGATVEVK